MFTLGWFVTGFGIQIKSPILTVVGFGVIQGIGLGLGYITPIKTLMIWFENKKGFAAGLTIAGFGIAGVIANPIIGVLLATVPIYQAFYILATIYGVSLFGASRLLYRPEIAKPPEVVLLKAKEVIFTKKFIFLWLVLFLNIACGLALISQERQIYEMIEISSLGSIVIFCIITAISNVLGRLLTASWQDKLKQKHTPYYIMAVVSLACCFVASINSSLFITTFIMIFLVQFFFGCGFGCLPNVLHQNYGIYQLSTVQGLILSAWGIAGLCGNQFSSFIMNNFSLTTLYLLLGIIYTVELLILLVWVKTVKKEQIL
jgi:OFA family oxalate/formate antiporter-like MFS transporter